MPFNKRYSVMSQSLTNILSHGVYQIVWPHCSKDNCCTSTRPSHSAGSCPFPPGLWLQTPTWRVLQIKKKVVTKIVFFLELRSHSHILPLSFAKGSLSKTKRNSSLKECNLEGGCAIYCAYFADWGYCAYIMQIRFCNDVVRKLPSVRCIM